MKSILKIPIFLFAIALFLSSCDERTEKKKEKSTEPRLVSEAAPVPTTNTSDIVLSPIIPREITAVAPFTLESLQDDFDDFSWRTFIALNWPANADGTADTNLIIGQQESSPTVWQMYKSSREVFLPNGEKPNAWGMEENLPIVCKNLSEDDLKKGIIKLTQVGKTHNVLDESGEPFQTGPLIDQNGQYTRYEILMNESMFNYIVENTLYNQEGQKAFNPKIDFPSSDVDTDSIGAIMVKAAWVKMGGKYDESKFHTTYALIYDNPHENAGVEPSCELQKVGLVGFHIAHKTETEPQWVWSTFEHVDNVPTQGEKDLKDFYNFYDPSSTSLVNEPPARPWDPGAKWTSPSQIERVIPITDSAKKMNTEYQQALENAFKGSVWANYELISTQWPTNGTSATDPTGIPAPSFLANATLETYIQGEVKQTSSSCIACHNNASTTDGRFSDFTYLLQRAQKQKK